MRQKLSIKLILILFLVHSTEMIIAQEKPLQQKITISFADETLEQCLKEISAQTGIFFSYNPNQIPIDTKINLEAKNESLQVVLDKLVKDLPIKYNLVEGQIILRKAKKETEPEEEPNEKKFTLSGFIKEKLSGEILIGAVIYFPEINKGTISNQYGFYSLTLPQGKYKGVFSLMGYLIISRRVLTLWDEISSRPNGI